MNGARKLILATFCATAGALMFSSAPAVASGGCPNEQLRAEQPHALVLPDCRAYEMVSPADTNGSDATEPGSSARASVSGGAIVFKSLGGFAGAVGAPITNDYLSRRGPGGWSTLSITPPQYAAKLERFDPYAAMAFTPELSAGVAYSDVPLTGEAVAGSFETYLANFASGSDQLISNVAEEQDELYDYEDPWSFPVDGASTDLSHVVFGYGNLNEWVNGHVIKVGVNNNGEPMDSGAGSGFQQNGGLEENERVDAWHAVSSDGSRVFFSSPRGPSTPPVIDPIEDRYRALYVRENAAQEQSALGAKGECTEPAKACTVEVSASERTPEDPNAPEPARFWGASADGSKVFFTDCGKLTDDSTAISNNVTCTNFNGVAPVSEGSDLYEYNFEAPEGERLTDLAVDGNPTDILGADVQGVVQISEDGSYVYFVADGRLAEGAVAGVPNLYASHEGGAPVLIATLAEEDQSDWANREGYGTFASPVTNTAAVSPDGKHLAFISALSLTGYDNEQAEPGECEQQSVFSKKEEAGECREVYLYDAETDSLECVSCNPSGARPIGPSSLSTAEVGYQESKRRSFSEDGALFFNSGDALVPHDSNGRQDVYEYLDGHVYSISDVAGNYESFFLDASPSGSDVFFGTADRLVAGDPQGNSRIVVYDARVDGGFPEAVSVSSCDNGDSCKPPPTPQPGIFGASASATFSGAGNVTPALLPPAPTKITKKTIKCKQGRQLRHGKCVKRKGKKSREAKETRNDRRSGS
ncbi:MAG: hypothetical protein ABSH36_04560 [Solirubrobacteraceae bacterium]